ncbi:MAG: efflux RND transporter periplasmic adaptor subunit [Clostridiales bacterium]|nr:efflux RND transporter periplasmic adaptor subunit [Clostridiales bacterium]MCF8023366.1 efflux RND transporter periplasmic adaptor subunit [Clostridiales bacterium]
MSNNALARVQQQKRLIFIFFAVLAALTVFIFTCYFYNNEKTIAGERSSLTATGTIEARDAMASFKIPGKLESLPVEEGSKIKKGQELASLENKQLTAKLSQAKGAYKAAQSQAEQAAQSMQLTSETIEAAVGQAKAKVAQAKIGVKNAKQQYERIKTLHDQGAISSDKYDKAKNNYDKAQGQLEQAESALDEALASRTKVQIARAQYEAARGQSIKARGALEEAQSLVEDCHLKAPIQGYITQKYLEEGEMVNAGTPVYEVTDLAHPYVKVFISEEKIGCVHLQQETKVKVDAYPDKIFKGKVVWINDAGQFAVEKAINEIHQHNIRSFEVKINVPNPDLQLKTGMTAEIRFLEGDK